MKTDFNETLQAQVGKNEKLKKKVNLMSKDMT
jgi:hypothetical protein